MTTIRSSDPDNYNPPRKWSFDRTVNIPTLIAVGTLLAATIGFGFDVVSDRDARMSAQDRRIDAVERTAESASDAARRIEAAQAQQARAQGDQLQALRNEVRGDLRDINNKLDTLIMGRIDGKPGLQPWAK